MLAFYDTEVIGNGYHREISCFMGLFNQFHNPDYQPIEQFTTEMIRIKNKPGCGLIKCKLANYTIAQHTEADIEQSRRLMELFASYSPVRNDGNNNADVNRNESEMEAEEESSDTDGNDKGKGKGDNNKGSNTGKGNNTGKGDSKGKGDGKLACVAGRDPRPLPPGCGVDRGSLT